jgi:hypothetical protein
MAILQAILAAVFRSAGKILNTAFGWATIMLFGKVPERKQTLLSAMGLGSVVWLVVALGVAFPRFGAFLLAFVPLPHWIDTFWVRMIMLALALLVPVAVGVLGLFILDKEQRPKGFAAKAKAILRGYPYTLGLALTLVMMILVAPVMKVRDLLRRWDSTHVPIIVEAPDYLDVVGDVQRVLRAGGFETRRERAPWMLRAPTKVFTTFAGGAVENLVADQLTVLTSPKIEVLLHPSDLVIRGREHEVARARALLTEHLTFTKAYQTWTKDANQLEDRLAAVWHTLKTEGDAHLEQCRERLRSVEDDLKAANLSFEEWEVLYRERMTVERGLLRLLAGLTDRPEDLTEGAESKKRASGKKR